MRPTCRWLDTDVLADALDAPDARVEPWTTAINAALDHAECFTDDRRAAFLAQIGHETGGLRWIEEIWGPTKAQRRYEGREDLGNTQPGDGYRFRGRGLIQTTGRANYEALTGRLDSLRCPDFQTNPDALLRPRWAALSAADYWLRKNLNTPADSGDFLTLTRRINGGTNGWDDRRRRLKLAKAALA